MGERVTRLACPANVAAFLDTLAHSEIGPALLAASDDGYNVLVGSTADHPMLFKSYADHPRQLVPLPKLGIKSTAAGRYQFLERTWDGLWQGQGRSKPFTPENQDAGCIELLRQCRAYPQIIAGNIEQAINLARGIWASLPGAGYGQHEHKMADLLAVYAKARARYDFSNVEAGSASAPEA